MYKSFTLCESKIDFFVKKVKNVARELNINLLSHSRRFSINHDEAQPTITPPSLSFRLISGRLQPLIHY